MKMIIFDLRSEIAHFRRPDTMGTQATYPFITRTALRGLVASILGLEMLPSDARCGIRLLSPVRTVAQEMSMHGKTWISGGDEKSFNRPTAIELVTKPHYRIYYTGPGADELDQRLQMGQSYYHTYLGSAYCLTFPKWVMALSSIELLELSDTESITCNSVVPAAAIKHLPAPEPGVEYARVGGVLREYLGNRRFRGTLSLLYEVNGRPLRFIPVNYSANDFWAFYKIHNEGIVCLW